MKDYDKILDLLHLFKGLDINKEDNYNSVFLEIISPKVQISNLKITLKKSPQKILKSHNIFLFKYN